MTRASKIIDEQCLSTAWAKAFLATVEHPEVSPLVVTVTGMHDGLPTESAAVREPLDADLREQVRFDVNTVANTIFPSSLWNPSLPRTSLFERYLRILPEIRKCHRPGKASLANPYGVYFQRLIAYQGSDGNQLEYIIRTYAKGNHRFSDLQASILDPKADHKNQRTRGFPCLQQVAFQPMGKNQLAIIGFYPKQHLYERGYGNYLGLCRLGRFMAHEMGLEFSQMTCFVGVGVHGKVKKPKLSGLIGAIKRVVGEEQQ